MDETYSHPQKAPTSPTDPPAAAPTRSIKPVDKLSKITKLNKRFRYRAAILREPDQDPVWMFGDRSDYFYKNYRHLEIISGTYKGWR